MDSVSLGGRLATYRNNLGFTLQQVGKWSKLPVSTINDYETGKIQRPDLSKLDQLCKVYGVSLSVLMASIEQKPTIRFRLNGFDVAENEKERIEDLVTFTNDYQNILELLEDKENIYLHRTYPNDPRLNWFDLGHRIAISERRYWGYSVTEPVDLLRLIQKEGILVNFIELPKSIDGFFYMTANSETFWIFVNANKPGSRKNFTLAHEYAHFLLDRDERNYFCNVTQVGSDPLEKRANAVAARLLVPKPALEDRIPRKITPHDVIELCHVFEVSSQVVNYRLIDEGFVSKKKGKELSEYNYHNDHLYQIFTKSMNKRFDLPRLDLTFGSPNLIQDEFLVKVKKAYELGKITFSRALSYFKDRRMAKLFGISPKKTEDLEYVF